MVLIDNGAIFFHSARLMTTENFAIRHIFISRAHNFVGHVDREPDNYPMEDCEEAELKAGSGIVGDRYFDHQPDYKGQVTFFDWETVKRMGEQFGKNDLEASVFRRNVITSGLDLNELIGQEFEVQGVRFVGTEEARPCHWMDKVIGEGAKDALQGWGGLRARIMNDGRLCKGPCAIQIGVAL